MKYYKVVTHGYTEARLTKITATYPAENAGDALRHHLKQNKHQDVCKAVVREHFQRDSTNEHAIYLKDNCDSKTMAKQTRSSQRNSAL